MNTDLHRWATTAGSAFARTEKRRATVVNGSTETDWQRKTAKALIIEAVLENGLAGSAIHHMRLWFFPLRSVSVGPFNSVAQSFSALPPDRGLSALRNDGKASANGRERID